tara:strand:+ start:1320 stop:2105 length:786 start_codon:yes stop_codon:yes gene_type:complete
MANLTGKSPKEFYKDFVQINNANAGVHATNPTTLQDGLGNNLPIGLSQTKVKIQPSSDTTNTFAIYDSGGNILFNVDATNDEVTTGTSSVPLNTQVKTFHLPYEHAIPSDTNWNAIPANDNAGLTEWDFGSSTAPATSASISTNAQRYIDYYWYVPYKIKIDAVKCMFTSDTATGDNSVTFSIGAYTVDTGNTATSGDLTSGQQLAVTVGQNSDGSEQIYFVDGVISTAEVTAGKVILAHVKQASNNSDINATIEVFYHFI